MDNSKTIYHFKQLDKYSIVHSMTRYVLTGWIDKFVRIITLGTNRRYAVYLFFGEWIIIVEILFCLNLFF